MMWTFSSGRRGGGVFVPYLLPGSPAGVWSLRKIVSGYAGKCINVVRSSDSTNTDIGFTATNQIDIAAFQAFGGNSTLFCSKWYDQSGNGMDVSSTQTPPQLLLINGTPYLAFSSQGSGSRLVAASVGTLGLTGDQTISMVTQIDSDISSLPIDCTDTTDGWAFFFNGIGSGTIAPGPNPGQITYWTNPANLPETTFNAINSTPFRMITTKSSGVATIYCNGVSKATASIANNAGSSTPFAIGGAGNFCMDGLIGEVILYNSALSAPNITALDASQASNFPDTGFSTSYNGVASVQFGINEQLSLGNVMEFERTNSWTAWAAIQLYSRSQVASIIYTNVPASGDNSFPGHEIWSDQNGLIRVRIISNIGTNNYLGVIGTTNIVDGKKHMIAYSYDGSSTAAGVKVYIDGVLETTTVEGNSLTSSIIGTGQSFLIGQQQGTVFGLMGTMAHFQMDNVVRSSSYISTIHGGVLPPKDGNTVARLEFTAGSGTTVSDTSGSGFNGTLTSSSMWVT
jgi:hypothetical protein